MTSLQILTDFKATLRLNPHLRDAIQDAVKAMETLEKHGTKIQWFSQEDTAPPHEEKIEALWKKQKGVNPKTGEAWLTPRMKRNAIRSGAMFKLEDEGIRAMLAAQEKS